MPVTAQRPPTTDEIGRFFYRGLNLCLSAETTAAQIQDYWKEMEYVMRHKLAEINQTTLDAEGRIIAERSAQPRRKAA